MSSHIRDPELTDACMETWRRLSPSTPSTPLTLATQRNQRGHMLRHLRLLARHNYARRVRGGYVSSQLRLPLS